MLWLDIICIPSVVNCGGWEFPGQLIMFYQIGMLPPSRWTGGTIELLGIIFCWGNACLSSMPSVVSDRLPEQGATNFAEAFLPKRLLWFTSSLFLLSTYGVGSTPGRSPVPTSVYGCRKLLRPLLLDECKLTLQTIKLILRFPDWNWTNWGFGVRFTQVLRRTAIRSCIAGKMIFFRTENGIFPLGSWLFSNCGYF